MPNYEQWYEDSYQRMVDDYEGVKDKGSFDEYVIFEWEQECIDRGDVEQQAGIDYEKEGLDY